jgi:hypothetical protein
MPNRVQDIMSDTDKPNGGKLILYEFETFFALN